MKFFDLLSNFFSFSDPFDNDISSLNVDNSSMSLFNTSSIDSSFDNSISDSHSSMHTVNPANGLPMMDDSIDVMGNPYGTDNTWTNSFSDSFGSDSLSSSNSFSDW